MRRPFLSALLLLSLTTFSLRADDTPPPLDYKPLDAVIGTPGVLKDDVCAYTLPRTDLDVAVDAMAVPPAAGVCSQLFFFHCSCGKTRVVGQICCTDYETNDVLDALRKGSLVEVVSIAPMFLTDRPRVSTVRFQGEGDALALAKTLKATLHNTGEQKVLK